MQKELLTGRSAIIPSERAVLQQRVTPNFSLLLSASGQQLLGEKPNIFGLLRKYRSDFEQNRDQSGDVRKKLTIGKEGTIFSVGDELPVVIKEYHVPFLEKHPDMPVATQTSFLRDTLSRTEQLRLFCESYAPEYIRVPKHYALLYLPILGAENPRECLLFMQRVKGVTMEQFNSSITTADTLKSQVREDWETQVKGLFDWDFPRTDPHFVDQPLVTDLFERNILVDLSSPTQDRPYTLWIIDQ